jgi:hypothetical protein
MNTSPDTVTPTQKHRREVWTQIITPVALPMVGLIVLCAALVIAVAMDALASQQVTIVMGILATAFIAFPMVILCLVPYFLLVVGAYGTGRLYAHSTTPLRRVRRVTEQMAAKTNRYVPRLARPLIGLNDRLTRWEHTLRGVQRSSLPPGKGKIDE